MNGDSIEKGYFVGSVVSRHGIFKNFVASTTLRPACKVSGDERKSKSK